MTTTDPYSTDDTSTNSTSGKQRIESPFSTSDDDSESLSEPPEINFEFILTSTEDFIEKLTERWWNFFDCILDSVGNNTETTKVDTRSGHTVTPLAPHFTGLRVALGGDKHTH